MIIENGREHRLIDLCKRTRKDVMLLLDEIEAELAAMEFISKPFSDAASGKSLSQVIQNVLTRHRGTFPAWKLPADPPKDFRGGILSYYHGHIELCGEIILSADGSGHAWDVMQVLRKPRADDKRPSLNAPKLADAVDPTGQLTDNAIASCIHDLRVRISNEMLDKANAVVGREDVIANLGKGYHLAAWLTIENYDGVAASAGGKANADGSFVQSADGGSSSQADGALTERQHWILGQLRDGVSLTRTMLQKHFDIREKQAKRELSGLSNRGLIWFIRKPRPGYYDLVIKNAAAASLVRKPHQCETTSESS